MDDTTDQLDTLANELRALAHQPGNGDKWDQGWASGLRAGAMLAHQKSAAWRQANPPAAVTRDADGLRLACTEPLENGRYCGTLCDPAPTRCNEHGDPRVDPEQITKWTVDAVVLHLRRATSENTDTRRGVSSDDADQARVWVNATNAEYRGSHLDPSDYVGLPWDNQGLTGRDFWTAVARRVREGDLS